MLRAASLANVKTFSPPHGPILYVGLSLVDFKMLPSYATGSTGVKRLQFANKDPFHLASQQLQNVGQIFYDAGKSGDTAANILARWAADSANYPLPVQIVFCDGGNDVNLVQSLTASNGTNGIEDVLSNYASGTLSLFNLALNNGIGIIMEALPDNGNWSSLAVFANSSIGNIGARTYAQMHTYYRMARWHKEISRILGFIFINHNVALVYPGRQVGQAATSITGNGTTCTATLTSPMPSDWATNDAVVNYTGSPGFGSPAPVIITKTGASTFTYAGTGNGTAAVPGTFQRINVNNNFFTIPNIGVHYNQKGSVRIGYVTQDALSGSTDWLAESEQDAENLVCVGQSGTGSNILNRGQMQGTGGTFTGTWNSTSGNVPTGWDVHLMNTSTGATATMSQPTFPPSDPARSLFQYMDATIVAGSTDAHVELRCTHTLPTNWAANTAQAVDSWVMPTPNGNIALVCIANTGNTQTGANQPTIPTTPGILVTDGNVTWECRRIWNFDGITKYRIGADFRFISQSAAGAMLSRALLLADDSNNYLIGDGDDVDANGAGSFSTTPAPLYVPGEHIHFCSPDAILRAAGSTTLTFALRLWVAANQTIEIQLGRATWYRTGYGIADTNGNILGAI